MFIFKRKSLSPLKETNRLLSHVNENILALKRDTSFMPTNEDMLMLHAIIDNFHEGYALVCYVKQCLRQRLNGEPEGAAKFTDEEAGDYHYPP